MTRVAMALSGGVDSTVAAMLLRRAGHEVIGLTLRIGAGPQAPLTEAPEAARALGIEHHVIDAAAEFEARVLAPAASAYAQGRTPNPCARCNGRVKFPMLWLAARKLGCEALATGHYARLTVLPDGPVLTDGADVKKSQAYFLARLRPEILERLILPLGGMRKEKVRDLARRHGLPAADRADSQDGCFLPPGGWDEVITGRGLARPGPIEGPDGAVLGRHRGLHRYTVGQRRGLGLPLGYPAYVLALDGDRAAVRVGPRGLLATRGFTGHGALWRLPPEPGEVLGCKVRYAAEPAPCRVDRQGDEIYVDFLRQQGAIAPGQLAVFYRGGMVAGSAWIGISINHQRMDTT